MKFSAIAITLISAVAAIDLSSVPACALACFAQGSASAGCNLNDLVCQCTTGRDAVTKAVTPCVTKQCSADDQVKTLQASEAICKTALDTAGVSSTASSAKGSAATSAAAASTRAANAAAVQSAGAGLVGAAGLAIAAALL